MGVLCRPFEGCGSALYLVVSAFSAKRNEHSVALGEIGPSRRELAPCRHRSTSHWTYRETA
jgi:hypothetical protein